MSSYFRIKEQVSLNSPNSPCSSRDNSYTQLYKKGMIDIFLNKTVCQSSSGLPCMIPQAKDFLPLDDQRRLQPCLSWAQYDCMIRRFSSQEFRDLVTSLQKDCKHKTVHISSKKAHNLDDILRIKVIFISSI